MAVWEEGKQENSHKKLVAHRQMGRAFVTVQLLAKAILQCRYALMVYGARPNRLKSIKPARLFASRSSLILRMRSHLQSPSPPLPSPPLPPSPANPFPQSPAAAQGRRPVDAHLPGTQA